MCKVEKLFFLVVLKTKNHPDSQFQDFKTHPSNTKDGQYWLTAVSPNYMIYLKFASSPEMIKSGNAWIYKSYRNNAYLNNLENYARVNKKGLWNEKNIQEPWEYRRNK